jgi:FixJ family two-component response regulator
VPTQVAFRLDFAAWLATLIPRHREIVHRLFAGQQSKEIACAMGLNRQYFCHLRAALRLHWLAFQAGTPFPSVRAAFLVLRAR